MSKYEGHTPGPWHACCAGNVKSESCHCGFILANDGRQTAVATVHHNDPDLKGYDDKIDITLLAEKNANALLIADAPKLARENEQLRAENRRLRGVLGAIASRQLPQAFKDINEYARAALAATEPEVCRWRCTYEAQDGSTNWFGDCGYSWNFAKGNSPGLWKTCPECGKPIKIDTEDAAEYPLNKPDPGGKAK